MQALSMGQRDSALCVQRRSSDIPEVICSAEWQHPFVPGGCGARTCRCRSQADGRAVMIVFSVQGASKRSLALMSREYVGPVAQGLLSFSKSKHMGAKAERLTFESGILLAELCQQGLKSPNCLQSSALIVSLRAPVISAKRMHLERSALH